MPRKLRLELDQLSVETFPTSAAPEARGTVHGASGGPGEPCESYTCAGVTGCRGTETSDSLSVEVLCVCTAVGYGC